MVEQWHNDGGTEEQLWWNRETVMVEKWTEMVEQWHSDGGTVEQ